MNDYPIKKDILTHMNEVNGLIGVAIAKLSERIGNHDLSKLEDPEIEIFNKYRGSLKKITYGSKQYMKILKKMEIATKHHEGINRHHPEYFNKKTQGMNLIDIIEMICDWIASSMIQEDGDIIKSIEINQKRFGYSDELKAILKNTAEEFLK
jgi:hypothetical protein